MSNEKAIPITVEFVGAIQRPWPEQKRQLTIAAGSTVTSLLDELGYGARETRYLVCHINGKKSTKATTLKAGDQVVMMLIIGGG